VELKSTVFAKILSGEIPAHKVFEDDQVLAFKDINPVAPVHVSILLSFIIVFFFFFFEMEE